MLTSNPAAVRSEYRALICATAHPSSFVDTMLPAHNAADAYKHRVAICTAILRSILRRWTALGLYEFGGRDVEMIRATHRLNAPP